MTTTVGPFDPLKFRGVAAVVYGDVFVTPLVGPSEADERKVAEYTQDAVLPQTCDPGFPDPTFDVAGRVCYRVEKDDRVMCRPDEALVVSSATPQPGVHRPVIDLDVPVRLVPSSTPGHAHLYIDVDVEWTDYVAILHALAAAKIVEPGYAHASEARGASFARLPWVRKVARA